MTNPYTTIFKLESLLLRLTLLPVVPRRARSAVGSWIATRRLRRAAAPQPEKKP